MRGTLPIAFSSLCLTVSLAPCPALGAAPPAAVAAFLDQHCMECHDADVKKAGLDLGALRWEPGEPKAFETWVKVLDRVRHGEMPPKKQPRPEAAAMATFLKELDAPLHAADAQARAQTGRTVLRRLNRNEYEHTLHDLLGISIPLAGLLPEDTPMHGFDTVAEGLRISQLQMEKYLEAADAAVEEAIRLEEAPAMVQKRYYFKDEPNTRKHLDTPVGAVTDKFNPKQKHRHLLKELPDAVVYFNEGYPPAEVRQFVPRASGVYRVRISAQGHQSGGRAIPMRVYRDNFREKWLLGWFEAPADKPRVVEVTGFLKSNEHLLIQPSDTGLDEKGQGIYNIGAEAFTGAGLALQWAEVEGPLVESWPPPSVKKLFGDTPLVTLEKKQQKRQGNRLIIYDLVPENPRAAARTLLESFATRAFRRPLEGGEADRFVRLVETEMDAGVSFVEAMKVGFRAVLTAPQFLLFQETPGRLDGYALASRLSYFLWSSMPDEELLKTAAEQRLSKPDVLRAQVERLLRHPRAARFVESFTGQWLELRNIDATTPDKRLYPEFDELLRLSMVGETQAFFAEMLKEDEPVAAFIDSPFAMLNSRMAAHYGIPGVTGEAFQRVALPVGSGRGGVLTHASILKVTANGTTTSPVVRGAWVMKQLLGRPPAPPPPNVGSIEPDTRGATTIREQLDKHRNSETCAGCHQNIDPPGFALESYDVIGGLRERYRSMENGERARIPTASGRSHNIRLGPPVDASGSLPDGRAFAGMSEFKKLLLEDQDVVLRAVTEKLLVYATGAGVRYADRQDVSAITHQVKAQGGGLRALVHAVVASPVFQSK